MLNTISTKEKEKGMKNEKIALYSLQSVTQQPFI
jgi:hypothetical protein